MNLNSSTKMICKLIKVTTNKTNTKWYTHWLKLPKNVFMWVRWGKSLALLLGFFLTPTSGKDFIRMVSGQNSYETILVGHHLYFLEFLSVSPPLWLMRLEANTTALTSSLLPSLSEHWSGNLNKSLGPFLPLFRLYENVTCKVREGHSLGKSHCCILNTTPFSWYNWEWGPRERGTLDWLSQSQKIILLLFQGPIP